MKVALVHDFLIRLGGAERVLKELADMYPDAPIYTLLYDEETVGEVFSKERVKTSFLQKFPGFLRKRHKYLFSLMPLAVERFDFRDYDLVISSSNAYAHGILTGTDTKHVCYCHSPMRYLWDWTHEYLKENNLKGFKLRYVRNKLHKMRIWDKAVADRPDVYVANSENTRGRIKKYYRLDSEVVYPPVDIDRFAVSDADEGYYLVVSTLTSYKKVDIAVEAFNKLGEKLVIIGDGADRGRLEKMAGENIEFRGFQSDEEVARAMMGCKAFVFPGEEDFGITPVEAMACGKPVIAYGNGGLTETVVDGETGVFFKEASADSLAEAVQRFQGMTFNKRRIRERAEKFGSERFRSDMRSIIDGMPYGIS